MNAVNLVVMGKTGAGKSTLINAILNEDLAPTGSGQTITKENHLYTKKMLIPAANKSAGIGTYSQVSRIVNLYDTVGLEIDTNITQRTLQEIRGFIQKAQECEEENDITLVWFCVNWRSSRFEDYEIDLIRSLSIDHEIPFLLVLTQCYTDEQSDLEEQVRQEFPEIPVAHVLAKDYKLKTGTVPAFGVKELLWLSVSNYDNSKVRILENKLRMLNDNREHTIAEIRRSGANCIESYSQKALKIGLVPGGCIPVVHGMCIAMISELNRMVGINATKGFATEIFTNAVLAIIATPLMLIPLISSPAASAYIEVVGDTYLDSIVDVITKSTNDELRNNDLMATRIKEEIQRRKK